MKASPRSSHATRMFPANQAPGAEPGRRYWASARPSAAPVPTDPTRCTSARTALPGTTAPSLATTLAIARTTMIHAAATRVCTIETSSTVRDNGPRDWASTSRITAHVIVGDAVAAKAPSTSATTRASRNGWCAVRGNQGLTVSVTSVTRRNGTAVAPAVTRSSAPRLCPRNASIVSIDPAANARTANALVEMTLKACSSSTRIRPSHGGPATKPVSR